MHAQNISHLECPRNFGDVPEARERSARAVAMLSAAMMIAELAVGYWTRSLALIADGWHMATHAGALGLTAVAYWFARSRARDRTFCFGTGKVHALAGYTSALVLMFVALSMSAQSVLRFIEPAVVGYRQALPVAIVGLIVNLASLKLLGRGHGDHDHDHDGGHGDTDHNHRAALTHVVADALTSVLAIVSLVLGAALDWRFLDPLMGLVGGLVVIKWGVGLCRAAGRQLLDATTSDQLERRIQSLLEEIDDVRVTDLHCWEVGPGRHACIATVITSLARDTVHYRTPILAACPIAHLTIEVHRCREGHSMVEAGTGALVSS